MAHSILPHDSNPVLREIARDIPLSEIESPRIKKLILEMKKLLSKEEHGVALAAPQVGESLRLFVVSGKALQRRAARYADEDLEETGEPLPDDAVYINPTILRMSRGKKNKHEGCLSIRGAWGIVPRVEKVTISYYDEKGAKHTRGASGLLAHIFQHEIDHLQGILYTDKAKDLYHEDIDK